MMIFSITKPKKKLKGAAIGLCLLLLLGVGVPAAYQYLSAEDAMSGFAEGDDKVIYVTDRLEPYTEELSVAEIGEENVTGDPIKVNATEENEAPAEETDAQTKGQMSSADVASQNAFQNIWQKILAVIFGSQGEVLYYSD